MAEHRYTPSDIEPRWQKIWADERTWEVSNDAPGDPYYVLEMLPYPSGEPHIGHLKVYSVGDAVAHFQRRRGLTVLHPMGYDAFGLPAENHAIRTGQHPRASTDEAIAQFQRQFREWGISIDWSREFGTHEPRYYRWTQWIFLKLFERGLAYRKDAAVKWCPNDQTVLANEQVIDGRCERCGFEVEVRQLNQWFFRITDYADRLLDDLETIDWPPHVKTMQRNWIGRSEGAEVTFACESVGIDYAVFTTRPDTLFGATFFVLAPEHPDIERLAAGTGHEQQVRDYINKALNESNADRGDAEKPKTGVPLGRTVTNPVNGQQLPMYVADYVLMEYGTGAVMAVPGHDQRDWEFARAFDLPIVQVVAPADGSEVSLETEAYVVKTDDGVMVNSREFDGLTSPAARDAIVEWLQREGRGFSSVNYRLRDWLLSRQRYWGCPIPIVHCERCGTVPVPEDELPVVLPDVRDYTPKGKSPLAAAEDWVQTRCPSCDGPARRETDTMDTFVDSSWYFLRYCDADNDDAPWDAAVLARWSPVDQYIGGIEHAILHLMYARFFVKALHDLELLGHTEPFSALFTQGMITKDGAKMSKSRGNVVSPQDIVARFGADVARCYILFIGPPEKDADWSDSAIGGVSDFLARLYRLSAIAAEGDGDGVAQPGVLSGPSLDLVRKAHWAMEKVTHDLGGGRFLFNTAIAAVMELLNDCSRVYERGTVDAQALRFALGTAASLVFPFAPHVASECYALLDGGARVWETPWPDADPDMLESDTFELVVQVNGKLRDRVAASAEASRDDLLVLAREAPNARGYLEGKELVKEVVVPGKLVNLVVR